MLVFYYSVETSMLSVKQRDDGKCTVKVRSAYDRKCLKCGRRDEAWTDVHKTSVPFHADAVSERCITSRNLFVLNEVSCVKMRRTSISSLADVVLHCPVKRSCTRTFSPVCPKLLPLWMFIVPQKREVRC